MIIDYITILEYFNLIKIDHTFADCLVWGENMKFATRDRRRPSRVRSNNGHLKSSKRLLGDYTSNFVVVI